MYHNLLQMSAVEQHNVRNLALSRFRHRQQGSALVIAIFIIIVFSVLGAALVNMLDSSQEGVAYEVLGTRAYTAAQSGLQWQLSEVFPLSSDAAACKSQVDIDDGTPNINSTPGLIQCNIKVRCSDFQSDSIRYYVITSTGECALDGEVTSRTVEVDARSL